MRHRLALLSLVPFALSSVTVAQQTIRVSVDSAGIEANGSSQASPSISADGSVIAFFSWASNLVPVDSNSWTSDVFVHDRNTATTHLVSKSTAGVQGDAGSAYPSISADGRFVAFQSAATNLVSGDTNGFIDIFVHDLSTGQTTMVSRSVGGGLADSSSSFPTISSDGRMVAFTSSATNLIAVDLNDAQDVFVHDRQTGITQIASRSSLGVLGNGGSHRASISANGQVVSFYSDATNLVSGDTNGFHDVFVRDLPSGVTTRVSLDSNGTEANERSWSGNLSADGQRVAFKSLASNLVAGDSNGLADMFVHDLNTGSTERVNVSSYGIPADMISDNPFISGDGRFVAFLSLDDELVADDANGVWDMFLHDTTNKTTTRVNVHTDGSESDNRAEAGSLSHDGSAIAFMSWASNLVAGDSNGAWDVFVREQPLPLGTSFCMTSPNSAGKGALISAQGSTSVAANDLTLFVSGCVPGQVGVFLYGGQQVQTPWGDGLRCAGGSTTLVFPPILADVAGAGAHQLDNQQPIHAGAITPGAVQQFQWVYRDTTAGTSGFNASHGLELAFLP